MKATLVGVLLCSVGFWFLNTKPAAKVAVISQHKPTQQVNIESDNLLKPAISYEFYSELTKDNYKKQHYVKSNYINSLNPPVKPLHIYAIQVGSFRTTDEANGLRANLMLNGYLANVKKTQLEDATWYRVIVGQYQDIDTANHELAVLQDKLGLGGMIISETK
jgi:cell division protein FtsN